MNRWSRIILTTAVVAATSVGVCTASIAAQPAAQSRQSAAQSHQNAASLALTTAALDPQTTPETHFVAVAPCRIVDTRVAGGALGNGASRAFYVGGTFGFAPQGGKAGGCGIPVSATAVAATVAAIGPTTTGYLKAWANGAPEPGSSMLNYFKASAVSTGTTQTIQPTSGPSLRIKNAGPTVNVVVDVSGYYVPQIQALIGSDGSIQAGTSRIVSTSHPGTGSYYITLDRPARQCSPMVSTFNLYRYASVGLSSSTTPNTISVYVWDLDPTTHKEVPTNYDFFITVSC